MTWTEARDRLSSAEVVLIPTGSTEQHGPHLPLLHDILSAGHVCRLAADRMYPRVVVVPPVPFGDSSHWLMFPGTISLRSGTFINILVDVCNSLAHHGVRRVVVVNGHGANINPLWEATWRIRREAGLKVAYLSYWSLIPHKVIERTIQTTAPGHADEFETSFALAAFPERVRREAIREPDVVHAVPEKYTYLGGVYFTHFDTPLLTKTGSVGDPRLANLGKGRKLLLAAVAGLVDFLDYFVSSPFGN